MFACERLNSFRDHAITPNTTTDSAGIITAKIHALFPSTVNAMIIEPNTTNGERSIRRSARFRPFCT